LIVDQEEVEGAVSCFFVIIAPGVDGLLGDLYVVLEEDICRAMRIIKESPACIGEQLVDFDAGVGFIEHGKYFGFV